MILIAGAMTAVLVMARRGGFSHWFSNPATHSTAVPGTKELYAPKQEYGNQGNLREPKSITLEPLSARLTGSVQEMALPASGKDTTSKSQDLITQFEEELAKKSEQCEGALFVWVCTAERRQGIGRDFLLLGNHSSG